MNPFRPREPAKVKVDALDRVTRINEQGTFFLDAHKIHLPGPPLKSRPADDVLIFRWAANGRWLMVEFDGVEARYVALDPAKVHAAGETHAGDAATFKRLFRWFAKGVRAA